MVPQVTVLLYLGNNFYKKVFLRTYFNTSVDTAMYTKRTLMTLTRKTVNENMICTTSKMSATIRNKHTLPIPHTHYRLYEQEVIKYTERMNISHSHRFFSFYSAKFLSTTILHFTRKILNQITAGFSKCKIHTNKSRWYFPFNFSKFSSSIHYYLQPWLRTRTM